MAYSQGFLAQTLYRQTNSLKVQATNKLPVKTFQIWVIPHGILQLL